MTDRHSAYLVVLDTDVREDDAEAGVLTALRHVKGVADVQPVTTDVPTLIAMGKRDHHWIDRLVTLIEDMRKQ